MFLALREELRKLTLASRLLTDLFFNDISELRILYFACSLFSVTVQDFSVIWIDFISSKISFSNSDKISSCLIPVNNLLLMEVILSVPDGGYFERT